MERRIYYATNSQTFSKRYWDDLIFVEFGTNSYSINGTQFTY